MREAADRHETYAIPAMCELVSDAIEDPCDPISGDERTYRMSIEERADIIRTYVLNGTHSMAVSGHDIISNNAGDLYDAILLAHYAPEGPAVFIHDVVWKDDPDMPMAKPPKTFLVTKDAMIEYLGAEPTSDLSTLVKDYLGKGAISFAID